MRRAKYLNAILTVNALLLSALVADRLFGGDRHGLGAVLSPPEAAARQPASSEGGMVSPEEQRNLMIAELRRMNTHMDKIEARLNAGLSVKVTEMPEPKAAKDAKAPVKDQPKP